MTKKEWENFGLSAEQRKKLSWDKLDALNLSPIRNPYTGEVRYITADQYDAAFKEDENARYERLAQKVKNFRKEYQKKEAIKERKLKKQRQTRAKNKEIRDVEKYKELTGKMRISKKERAALKYTTPKQLAKERSKTKEQRAKAQARRIKQYEKKYGKVDEKKAEMLYYSTPARVAKYTGDKLTLGWIEYHQFENWARNWQHTSGSWMYMYSAWDGFDADQIIADGPSAGGFDRTNRQVMDLLFPHLFPEYELVEANKKWRVQRKNF